jgi:hypothetical protein
MKDPEKGGSAYSSKTASARGSAAFLAEVESTRSIKVPEPHSPEHHSKARQRVMAANELTAL